MRAGKPAPSLDFAPRRKRTLFWQQHFLEREPYRSPQVRRKSLLVRAHLQTIK